MSAARYNPAVEPAPLKHRAQVAFTRRLIRLLALLGVRERVLAADKRRRRKRRLDAEAAGSDRFSHPALHGMDAKIDAAIDRDGGFFVEAGANDGFTQSNTYWLERFRGWRGILVEPMPTYYEQCRAERPDATIVHAALVPHASEGDTVRMEFGDLWSTVQGAHGDAAAERDWVAPGLVLGWHDAYTAEVPARTLSSILEEHGAPEVDLLSLDIEGFCSSPGSGTRGTTRTGSDSGWRSLPMPSARNGSHRSSVTGRRGAGARCSGAKRGSASVRIASAEK